MKNKLKTAGWLTVLICLAAMAMNQLLPGVKGIQADESIVQAALSVTGSGFVSIDDGEAVEYADEVVSFTRTMETGSRLDLSMQAEDGYVLETLTINGCPVSFNLPQAEYSVFIEENTDILAAFAPALNDTETGGNSETGIEADEKSNAKAEAETAVLEESSQTLEGKSENLPAAAKIDTEPIGSTQKSSAEKEDEKTSEKAEEASEISGQVKKRMETAERLGIQKYVDQDGYLVEEFWQDHDLSLLVLEDYASLNRQSSVTIDNGGIMTLSNRVGVSNVTVHTQVSMPWGYWMSNGIWTLDNGELAFCANGLSASPTPSSTPVSQPELVKNEKIRKVLYYGYNGPKNQLTSYNKEQQIIITNDLLSYANVGSSIGHANNSGYHWNAGLKAVYEKIQALESPAANYKVYSIEFGKASSPSWTGSYESQPLMYGVLETAEISLSKSSSVSALAAQKAYSLEGAQYGVYTSEADAKADQNRLGVLTTNASGKSNTLSGLEPKSYFVKEIKAPSGYELDETIYKTDEKETSVNLLVKEQPLLGSIALIKTDDEKNLLAKAEFTLFNNNGSTIWHDANSNGKEDEGELIAHGEKIVSVMTGLDGKAVFENLSYGKYTVKETRIPIGFFGDPDWSLNVEINAENPDAEISHINEKTRLATLASSENGSHEQQASGMVTIVDTVSYFNLPANQEYIVKGVLMNRQTGEALKDKDGNEVRAESEPFAPEESTGSIEVFFILDAADLAGIQSVVFEELYTVEGELTAEHKDLNDEGQSINFIDIKTEAFSDQKTHQQVCGEEVILIDEVSYTGLTPGREYVLDGVLMNKETGEKLLDKDGKPIQGQTVFTPVAPDGMAEVEFRFNAMDMDGQTAVVFEQLSAEGTVVAVHEDINDALQSVEFVTYSVLVNKVDADSGKNITNSQFEFTAYEDDQCSKVLSIVKGDSETGTALFDGLHEGALIYIKETSAPQGYILSDEVVKVEVKQSGLYVNDVKVTDNGYLHSIVYKNSIQPAASGTLTPGAASASKAPSVSTGSKSGADGWLAASGLAVLASSSAMVIRKRKSRRK